MLTDIFIAAPSEAEAICIAPNHEQSWARLELKNLDNIKLAALLALLGDDEGAMALEGEALVVFNPDPDGPWVFALPETLKDMLTNVKPPDVASLASRWAMHDELKFDRWTSADVEVLLGMLIAFAKRARDEHKSLLLWMCL
jgi:hypothetical protein